MKRPKISIGIILFTGCEKYLPFSLGSLMDQSYDNAEILLRDQSPNKEVAAYIKAEMPEVLSKMTLSTGENKMHSGGHNLLISASRGEAYITASVDMWYPPDFLAQVAEAVIAPQYASFGYFSPKLLQWDFVQGQKTNRIDSCGIGITPYHHFYDRGQGEKDGKKWNRPEAIFGASGALTIIRKTALSAIACGPEYYDELLHYKNDVDLAYRLQWAGIKGAFLPHIKVWHDRQVAEGAGLIKGRKAKSQWARANSLKGHLIVLKKHMDPKFSWKIKCQTHAYEIAKKAFIAVREPSLLKVYKEVNALTPLIEVKKNAMRKTVNPATIENLMQCP